jgi:phage baseplate assembly protein W
MSGNFINIQYPFKNSEKGQFIMLTETDKDAIKSDLMHLILTAKGERFYKPDFGTNLLRFIFEPNDEYTEAGIIEEISSVVTKYLPNLKVTSVSIETDPNNEYTAVVSINYNITEDVFQSSDVVIIKI